MKPKLTAIASTFVALAGLGAAGLAGSRVILHAHQHSHANAIATNVDTTGTRAITNTQQPGNTSNLGNTSASSDSTKNSTITNTASNALDNAGNSAANEAAQAATSNAATANAADNSGSTGSGANSASRSGSAASVASSSKSTQTSGSSSTPGSSNSSNSTAASGSSTSSGSSASGSASASSGSSSPQVLGSGNGPFDDSVKPGYCSRAEVIATFGKAVGIKPDTTGSSPFKDLSSTDPNWGMIHAMIEKGLVRGISSTYFGASITYRVRDLSSLYLAYAGIQILPSEYDPGFDQPLGWARTVGLLNGVAGGYPTAAYKALGPGDGLCVRPADLTAYLANVKAFLRGYRTASRGYDRLIFPVQDEEQTLYGLHLKDSYQTCVTKTYQTMNDILIKQSGNDLVLSLPAFAENSEWSLFVGNKVQFSLDNGSTWQTATNSKGNPYSFYGSSNANLGAVTAAKLPSRILIKSPMSADLWIRFSDSANLIVDEDIKWTNGAPSVTRNNVLNERGP